MKKMQFEQAKEDEWPQCPYCHKEIRQIKFKTRGFFTSTAAYWCPHCKAILGLSSTFNG